MLLWMKIVLDVFSRLFSVFWPLFSRSFKESSAMKSSYVRLVDSSRDSIRVELSHEERPGYCVVYGTLSFSRLTCDMAVLWTVDCPLSFADKLAEILRFIKLVRDVS